MASMKATINSQGNGGAIKSIGPGTKDVANKKPKGPGIGPGWWNDLQKGPLPISPFSPGVKYEPSKSGPFGSPGQWVMRNIVNKDWPTNSNKTNVSNNWPTNLKTWPTNKGEKGSSSF